MGFRKSESPKKIQDYLKDIQNSYIKIPKLPDLKLRPILSGPAPTT